MALVVDRSRLEAGTERWRLCDDGKELAFADVVRRWTSDTDFRSSWNAGLRELPFDAYAFECPQVTATGASRPFECVFVSSPSLARTAAEPEAFAEHFRDGCRAVSFGNLGGDAMLIAPCPGAGDFTHLARFVATATPEESDAFWKAVGAAMQMRIGDRPVWLSTAGLGVGWLHARLDDRPKYYRHAAYTAG